jgi:hypothetical protein
MSDKDAHEVGGEVGWSSKGLLAKIKSRFVASVDRRAAIAVDKSGIMDQRIVGQEAERAGARKVLIDAALASAVAKFDGNPDVAIDFLAKAIPDLIERQANYEAVVEASSKQIEDLDATSLRDDQTPAGEEPSRLSDDFMARFRSFAERATEEVVRERWARVLVTEVIKPGTFSPKVLRAIDEIDPLTASSFAAFAALRLNDGVPMSIVKIEPHFLRTFIEDGLVDPSDFGFHQIANIGNIHGEDHFYFRSGTAYAVAVSARTPRTKSIGGTSILAQDIDGAAAIDVYRLTSLGQTLAALSPYEPLVPLRLLAAKLATIAPDGVAWVGAPFGDNIRFSERVDAVAG